MKDNLTEVRHCIYCKREIDCETALEGAGNPQDGDFTICIYCGGVGVFKDGKVCLPSREEMILFCNSQQGPASLWATLYMISERK